MTIKNIFSLATSITSLFIIILYSNISSKADETNIKYYSKDEGILSIMYHRFNESKYPSTNIQMEIFKEHIQIIKNSDFKFHNPDNFKEQFNTIKLKKEILKNNYLKLTKAMINPNLSANIQMLTKKQLVKNTQVFCLKLYQNKKTTTLQKTLTKSLL